jgi:hypothetical protein
LTPNPGGCWFGLLAARQVERFRRHGYKLDHTRAAAEQIGSCDGPCALLAPGASSSVLSQPPPAAPPSPLPRPQVAGPRQPAGRCRAADGHASEAPKAQRHRQWQEFQERSRSRENLLPHALIQKHEAATATDRQAPTSPPGQWPVATKTMPRLGRRTTRSLPAHALAGPSEWPVGQWDGAGRRSARSSRLAPAALARCHAAMPAAPAPAGMAAAAPACGSLPGCFPVPHVVRCPAGSAQSAGPCC